MFYVEKNYIPVGFLKKLRFKILLNQCHEVVSYMRAIQKQLYGLILVKRSRIYLVLLVKF